MTLPHIRLVEQSDAKSPVDKARERFGRKFAYELGNDFQRHPESVLDRWRRKANWHNVNPKKEKA